MDFHCENETLREVQFGGITFKQKCKKTHNNRAVKSGNQPAWMLYQSCNDVTFEAFSHTNNNSVVSRWLL